jgi:hypothetical protein
MAKKEQPWVARVELPRRLQEPTKKIAKLKGMTLQGYIQHLLNVALIKEGA